MQSLCQSSHCTENIARDYKNPTVNPATYKTARVNKECET